MLKLFLPTLRTVLAAPYRALALLLDTGDCQAAGGPLDCKLHNVLHLLYTLAIVFGIALAVVGLGAWIFYRRSRSRRLEGEGR